MEWMRAILFVMGVSQLTYSHENVLPIHQSLRERKPILTRSPTREKERPDEVLPSHVLYHLSNDVKSPSIYSGGPLTYGNSDPSSDFLAGNAYLTSDSDSSYGRLFTSGDSSNVFGEASQESDLSQEWDSNTISDIDQNTDDNNKDFNYDVITNFQPLNVEEEIPLQKRLTSKGNGLLGSVRGASSPLVGLSKPRAKGLVLSIDLGIKALRDAIMHAKVQQKNRQHKIQVQKNLRLLHNIGKRTQNSSNLHRL